VSGIEGMVRIREWGAGGGELGVRKIGRGRLVGDGRGDGELMGLWGGGGGARFGMGAVMYG